MLGFDDRFGISVDEYLEFREQDPHSTEITHEVWRAYEERLGVAALTEDAITQSMVDGLVKD